MSEYLGRVYTQNLRFFSVTFFLLEFLPGFLPGSAGQKKKKNFLTKFMSLTQVCGCSQSQAIIHKKHLVLPACQVQFISRVTHVCSLSGVRQLCSVNCPETLDVFANNRLGRSSHILIRSRTLTPTYKQKRTVHSQVQPCSGSWRSQWVQYPESTAHQLGEMLLCIDSIRGTPLFGDTQTRLDILGTSVLMGEQTCLLRVDLFINNITE